MAVDLLLQEHLVDLEVGESLGVHRDRSPVLENGDRVKERVRGVGEEVRERIDLVETGAVHSVRETRVVIRDPPRRQDLPSTLATD